MFNLEIEEAMRAYDKYIVCLDRPPDDFGASLLSLVGKAITAYENRGPNLRHGIALDRFVTVILSQNDTLRPLCGIYFNLHTPYKKRQSVAGSKEAAPKTGGKRLKRER